MQGRNTPSTEAPSALGGQKLLNVILESFLELVDPRLRLSSVKYELHEVLNAAFAIFVLKFPSLLQFEKNIQKGVVGENLRNVFRITNVSSDSQMREILDDVHPQAIRPTFKKLVSLAVQSKALLPFRFYEDKYLVSVDGTGVFSSNEISCSSCLVKEQRKGTELLYQHQLFAGAIVAPDQKIVIPLFPEPIGRDDGRDKNDCERNAFKRFIAQFREDFPRIEAIIVSDAIGATTPQIEQIRFSGLSYILGVKPGSHKTLFKSVKGMADRGGAHKQVITEMIGEKVKKKRTRTYFWVNEALLAHTDLDFTTNFLDFTETVEWECKGKPKKTNVHFSWVTDFHLSKSNVEKITQGGRARWKIENETFNTLKNRGYHFEHNYGHGYKNLSNLLATLMMLAFLFDQLQELGCKLFKKALITAERRLYLWQQMSSIFHMIRFSNWQQLMTLIAYPGSYELRPAPA